MLLSTEVYYPVTDTAQRIKFSIKIWSHLLKKSLTKIFIVCAVRHTLGLLLKVFVHNFIVAYNFILKLRNNADLP